MNMDKINLSENHIRSVSASLYVIERTVIELEHNLKYPEELAMSKVVNNIGDIDIQHYISVIDEIKTYIFALFIKYNLDPTEIYLSQIINSKKSRIWEILCETTSKRLKGYGDFPKENAEEFDNDIDHLQRLIACI